MMFHPILLVHIAAGTLALASGPIPMLCRKGSTLHRRAGMVYVTAMMVAASAGFVLASLHWNPLLLAISVFTAFLLICGVRAIRFRRGAKPAQFDDTVCVAAVAFSFWLLWFGVADLDVLALFFGAGGWILAIRQWRTLRQLRPDWLIVHLTSMGAAYIATVTAFLVVNITFLPQSVVFIGPALVGTVLVSYAAIRRYDSEPSRLAGSGG